MRNWILSGWWLLTAVLAVSAIVGPRLGATEVRPEPTTGPEPLAIVWAAVFALWAALTVILIATRRNKPAPEDPPD